MCIDLQTNEQIDPFDGMVDLEQKILRAPDKTFFAQDPLRLFRVMQFMSRFEMKPDKELNALCKKMDIKDVSRELIEQEFNKMLLKSKRPSLGIRWLNEIGRLQEILPELAATIGIEQDPSWHPEGDVFEHTMQTLDAAAKLNYSDQKKLLMMHAALCHDLGKVTTTKKINGEIKSLGHDQESAKIAKKMLKRITNNKELISGVQKLVAAHMVPLQFYEQSPKPTAYKRLANKLAPEATISMLADLTLADRQGRNEKSSVPLTSSFDEIDTFIKAANKANVLEKKEEPILHGRDFMDVVEPGPEMGILVKRAYELQLEEGITDKDKLKQRVLEEKK